ncbi:Uncharacterized protein dnl_56120 [Desulfonema limicola]|uniref:Uncharacterized protein n=1 Tax=Desulfonema limicola TaxID=45656 RepID=A0A975GJ47_9BACT|nr:Uncharacterized protein dnl_56120 [Desulfonema limicola]
MSAESLTTNVLSYFGGAEKISGHINPLVKPGLMCPEKN